MSERKTFSACVVKIASRCNLNCSYCYVYNKGDLSYKEQPKFLSEETIMHFFKRIDEYLAGYEPETFGFVFHGGEPLMAPKTLYRFFLDQARTVFRKHNKTPSFAIQTNGVLVDEAWADFLIKENINVGISLDGTQKSNDQYRVYHNNKSAYEDIIKGFSVLKNKTPERIPGVLSVIDLDLDPMEVYEHYKTIGADYINLLFPDDTHDSGFRDDLRLGKWMLEIFRYWIADRSIKIDQFEVLLSIFYGADFLGNEYYGTSRNNTFILETNGEIQANDPLRVCLPNIHKTHLNVRANQIEELLQQPLADLYYDAKRRLCGKCNQCALSDICAGGYLINRYSKANGFDNPSIYCKSLSYFITHVQNMIAAHTNQKLPPEEAIEYLDLEEMMAYCDNNDYSANPALTKFKSE